MYINLGGKDRVLKFNYKALDALGTHFDTDLTGIFEKISGDVRISTITAYVWAMLKNNEGWKDATFEDVEDAIDEAMEEGLLGLTELSSIIDKTLEKSVIIKKLLEDVEASIETEKPSAKVKSRSGKK